MSRRSARRLAFQILYQEPFHKDFDYNFALENYAGDETDEDDITAVDREYLHELLFGILAVLPDIDRQIELISSGWRMDRLNSVDLALIRLAMYELLYTATPPQAAINEAVELAKKFSEDKSSVFVNGILGAALKGMKSREEPSTDDTDIAGYSQLSIQNRSVGRRNEQRIRRRNKA
ncbi:MAG: transcription antitermination factor NusB [Clostridiales bacterium]|jgi:N utilization substance protein B|nr:transcription antitermination factor NusB [Clostridiales bacterium]